VDEMDIVDVIETIEIVQNRDLAFAHIRKYG